MSHEINLNISSPCSEKFENFQPTELGGFCRSCQKEVVDFTKMTDSEIFRYFENQKGKTCGRFDQTQLKTYAQLTQPKPNRRFSFLGAGILSFSLLSVLPFGNLHAQKLAQATATSVSQGDEDKNTKDQKKDKDRSFIEGIVIDDQGYPLVGASVLIKGTTTGIFTSEEGKFKLFWDFKPGDKLVISYVGFASIDYEITENSPAVVKVVMDRSYCVMTGEVAVNHVYSSKRTFWQKLTGKK